MMDNIGEDYLHSCRRRRMHQIRKELLVGYLDRLIASLLIQGRKLLLEDDWNRNFTHRAFFSQDCFKLSFSIPVAGIKFS